MKLTNEQRRVAYHPGGHARVIAVAGSGKSTAMIARIQHLMQQGVPGERIWAVMFNSAARDSFRDKIKKQNPALPEDARPKVFTFHGCGSNLIKKLTPEFLPPGYTFEANVAKANTFARKIIEPYCEANKVKVSTVLDDFCSFVDLVKAGTDKPETVFKKFKYPENRNWFTKAYSEYEKKRKQEKLRFFADLIYDPVMALVKNKKAWKSVGGMMDHLIVDEYQDINETQQLMMKAIAGDKAMVVVVGDPDQTIYGWRGARPDFILHRFGEDFPNPTTYFLSRTFRYGHALSMAANYVITNNQERIDQLCISGEGTPKTTVSLEVDSARKPVVPALVNDWCSQEGRSLSDIAVLVRNFSHSLPVELSLLEAKIPYRIEGGVSAFLTQAEIGAILFALKIACGKAFSNPRVDKKQAIDFIRTPSLYLKTNEEWDLVNSIASSPREYKLKFSALGNRTMDGNLKKRLTIKSNLWDALEGADQGLPSEIIKFYYDRADLDGYFRHRFPPEKCDEKNQFFEVMCNYASEKEKQGYSTTQFVEHIDKLFENFALNEKSDDQILITSCHRSKGLEWPMVIMAGLSEGKFPFIPANDPDAAPPMEDERRLFYVAMTRAREKLACIIPNDNSLMDWLGNVKKGSPWGMMPSRELASRFLYESNLFLAQRSDMFIKKGALPGELASQEGADIFHQYLKMLNNPESDPLDTLVE